MIGTFPGKLALSEGDEVDVDLEIAGGKLRLTTGVSEIGSWPTESCAITPVGDGYRLTLDGELVSFTPDHPEAFAAVVRGMSPSSSSTSAPVPVTDPEPESGSGYDLEAALDQVLGGAEQEHPGVVFDDSPDDIAVTLEALFATAYPDYEAEHDDEEAAAAYEGLGEASPTEDETSEFDPVVAPETPIPTDPDVVSPATDAAPEPGPVIGDDSLEVVELDDQPEPAAPTLASFGIEDVVDESGVFSGDPVDDLDLVDELEPAANAPELPSVDEIDRRRAAAVGDDVTGDELDDLGPFPDAGDRDEAAITSPDAARFVAGHDGYHQADEERGDDELDDLAEAEPTGWGGADRFRPGSFRPGGPAAYDDGDVYHDSPYGGGHQTNYPPPGPSYTDPAPEERPAASYGYGDRPAASFDIDQAADSPGYTPPSGGIEDEETTTAGSGMFSRSASERFASVSGAIRSRLVTSDGESSMADETDDDGMSIADQIVAEQAESLQIRRTGKRFSPELVKKLSIGAVILFVVAGLVMLTPALVRVVVEQIEAPQGVTTVTTNAPQVDEPATTTPTTVPSLEDPAESADEEPPPPPVLSEPVFSLRPAEFAERWDTVVDNSTLSIGQRYEGTTSLGLTEFLGIVWTVDDDGTLGSYRIVLDPKGDPRDDELGIAALALAIDVSHPEYEGDQLADVLRSLGLDVQDTTPALEFLDPVVRDGIRYGLTYDAERELVFLDITPASAGPTTTTPSESSDTTTP